MTEVPVIQGFQTESVESAAVSLALMYTALGTSWNHQDKVGRFMEKVFGPTKNGCNHN